MLDTGRVALSGSAAARNCWRGAICTTFIWVSKVKAICMTETIRNADVLIIGGGLSGTMLAVQLLRLLAGGRSGDRTAQ